MRADKQTSYSNTYLYNHSSKLKCKRVRKKTANTDNTPMCYRRGNRRTRRKTSPPPSKQYNGPLENQLGYMNSNRPSKPNLPDAPKPFKLLAPIRLRQTVSFLVFRIPQ